MKNKTKFEVMVEEVTSRYQQGGLLNGDFVIVRKDALGNEKLKGRPSNFIDKLKEMIAAKTPLRVCAIKSERPESSNDLIGGANNAPTAFWVDVVIEYAPGLWRDPVTLPLEVLDIANPDNQNLPAWPDEVKRKDNTTIKPEKQDADQTPAKKGKEQKGTKADLNLPTKNVTIPSGKSVDGRDQTKVKESQDLSEMEQMALLVE